MAKNNILRHKPKEKIFRVNPGKNITEKILFSRYACFEKLKPYLGGLASKNWWLISHIHILCCVVLCAHLGYGQSWNVGPIWQQNSNALNYISKSVILKVWVFSENCAHAITLYAIVMHNTRFITPIFLHFRTTLKSDLHLT